MSLQHRRRIYFACWAAAALAVAAVTGIYIQRERAEDIDRSFAATALQARVSVDHLTRTLSSVDETLDHVAELDPLTIPGGAAVKSFDAALRHAPYLRSLAVLDAAGIIVASSNPRNVGRRVALDDFMPPRTDSTPVLRIGPPWIGRDFDQGTPGTAGVLPGNVPTFVPVARDVVMAGGRRMTVMAALNPDHFVDYYHQLLGTGSTTVQVLRYDGSPLISTGALVPAGERWPADPIVPRIAQRHFDQFEQRLANGLAVLTAYRVSSEFPLVVVVNTDRDHALARWLEDAWTTASVVAAALLSTLVLAALYHARAERFARLQEAAETGRRASESLYRNTFEHAAVGIAHTSFDGRLLRCNQHLCDLLGYSAQEFIGMRIGEITCSADTAADRVARQRLVAGEIAHYSIETRYTRKNGAPLWTRVSVGLIRASANGAGYMVEVIEDIHLRKLTRLAMNSLNTDLAGEPFLRQTTQALAELLGVEYAFVGESDRALPALMKARAVVADGKAAADYAYGLAGSPCETVTANEVCIYAEQVRRRFPGDDALARLAIESYAAVALGATREGVPLGVLAVMSRRPLRDLEAVKTLLPMLAVRVGAELLREREARKFRDLFDGSPSAIFLVDEDTTIRLSSRSGDRLFGWSPGDLNGQSIAKLYPEELRATLGAKFRRFVAASATGAIDEEGSTDSTCLRWDGSTFPSQTQLRVLETAEGRMTVAHVQDIADRKDAEADLRRFTEELESVVTERTAELMTARDAAQQASRAKSAFLAAMSHEIRTPMNGVVGMIDVLEQSSLKGSQVEIVKTVRESAYALLGIVDDVLDFSKIEAGQFQVDSEPLSVAAVVEGVCDTLRPIAVKKGVELTLFTDPALPPQLLGDAMRLRQVLLNLAGNAIKFSSSLGRAGRVCVRARLAKSGPRHSLIAFNVTDNGIGMDPPTVSRLFTPFTQADAGTTRRFGGTGLGLSISHGLVVLMNGEISVCSEPGRGSDFSVHLSLATPAPTPALASNADEVDIRGLVCLVLEGTAVSGDDLAVYLAHGGADVHRAADLEAARQWLARCAAGMCIVVVVGVGAATDEALDEVRAAGDSRADVQLRLVVVEIGRRSHPRGPSGHTVGLSGQVLHRRDFLRAVALAAGRIAADAVEELNPAAADTMPAPLSMQEASSQGRLILVAEDNEINQKVVLKQLTLLGYKAEIAATGREALDCWQRGDYALLLTDLHMPQMDGYELTAAIRQAEACTTHMPIVALTANALKGEAKRCLAMGMDDYMTKPVQLKDLKAMLLRWLPAAADSAPAGPVRLSMAGAGAPPVLDVRVLEALVGDDLPVIAELLQEFRLSAVDAATRMRLACQADDTAKVAQWAHRLKSSARSVGALALGELCAQLEGAGLDGNVESIAERFPAFEAEVIAVDEYLVAWRAEADPGTSRRQM
jgi:PAS domain S-box-containing protein